MPMYSRELQRFYHRYELSFGLLKYVVPPCLLFLVYALLALVPDFMPLQHNGYFVLGFYVLFFGFMGSVVAFTWSFPTNLSRIVCLVSLILLFPFVMFGAGWLTDRLCLAYEDHVILEEAQAGNPMAQMQLASRAYFAEGEHDAGFQAARPWLEMARGSAISWPGIFLESPDLFNECWAWELNLLDDGNLLENGPDELKSYIVIAMHRYHQNRNSSLAVKESLLRLARWADEDKTFRSALSPKARAVLDWYLEEESRERRKRARSQSHDINYYITRSVQ